MGDANDREYVVEIDGDRGISALSRRQEQAWHHAMALVKMKTTSWALCLANQFFAKTAYHLDASIVIYDSL